MKTSLPTSLALLFGLAGAGFAFAPSATAATAHGTRPQIAQPASAHRAPPPPRHEKMPAARRGYVWAPGYWRTAGHSWAWVPGHWVNARAGWRYTLTHWVRERGGWRLQAAAWRR